MDKTHKLEDSVPQTDLIKWEDDHQPYGTVAGELWKHFWNEESSQIELKEWYENLYCSREVLKGEE